MTAALISGADAVVLLTLRTMVLVAFLICQLVGSAHGASVCLSVDDLLQLELEGM